MGFTLRVVHSVVCDKCVMPCIRHARVLQKSFTALQTSRASPLPPSPTSSTIPQTRDNHSSLTVSTVVPFPECQSWDHCLASSDRLLSLGNMHSRFMSFYGLTAHFFLLSNNGKAPMIIPIITAVCVIRRASYTLIRSLTTL